MQLHAAAAEVGQQLLQGGQLRGRDGQLQSGTFAVVVFGLQQGVEAGELRFEQRQLGKIQVAVAAQALHQLQCLAALQAFGGAAAIGAGQAAGAELDAAVDALVADILQYSPSAIRLGLEAFNDLKRMPASESQKHMKQMLGEALKTEDAAEGLQAFIEKRKPVWKGK